jgi:hypothetical protein
VDGYPVVLFGAGDLATTSFGAGILTVELHSVAAIALVESIQKCANTVNMPNQIHGYNLIRAINIRVSF